MAVICVNCYPTQSRTGQTNNVSECALCSVVFISYALTSDLDTWETNGLI